jgi:hypothetical protein
MCLRKRIYWKLKEEALDRTLWRSRLRKDLWTCRKTDNSMNVVVVNVRDFLNQWYWMQKYPIFNVFT